MPSFFVHSFGCRASAADGDGLGRELIEAGHRPAGSPEGAELVVINTCAVTATAERSARALIRRIQRRNPAARVLVTGCYAQRAPGEIAALPGVSAVIGNSHKAKLVQIAGVPMPLVAGLAPILQAPYAGEHLAAVSAGFAAWQGAATRTRPVLKVQDGCGNRCSFCVIPETRGPSRSVPAIAVLEAARQLAEQGVQEAVLSGINLGRWGCEFTPRETLASLVRRIVERSALPCLRLSSIEPMDWSPELLALLGEHGVGEDPRIANHAHLPLQSGADAILRRMHRRYRPWHYAEKLDAIAARLPDAALGADILVGFPGETDALFQESYDFVARLPLTYFHLFPFSPRPKTRGEELHRESPVSGTAVRERMAALEALGEEKTRRFRERFLGRTLNAVTLNDGTALTSNFLSVFLAFSAPANQRVWLEVASTVGDSGKTTLTGAAVRDCARDPGLEGLYGNGMLEARHSVSHPSGGSHR